APRAEAEFEASPPALDASAVAMVTSAATAIVPEPDPEPEAGEVKPDGPSETTEIEQLARDLRDAGDAARKVTVLGSASSESITWTALKLARLIAQGAKVVVVDLSAALPT